MKKITGFLSPKRAGVFVACAVLAASASFDVMASNKSGTAFASPYDSAVAYSYRMASQGNNVEFTMPTAAEREAADPFVVLSDRGVDVDPIRAVAAELALDLSGIEIAIAGGRANAAVVPAADRKCLAQAIYYEARNQSSAGQMAVADVILNRVDDKHYPGSVCGVVYQGAKRETGCQFSFTCDGSMTKPVDVLAMKDAQRMAEAVLSGLRIEITRGALNYHANYVAPYWAPRLHKTAVVDDHVFYTPVRYAQLAQGGTSAQ
ncbi:cell wall hydrolase [Parvularcula marina]|uniref:cell wall hydrolase n=1 Tax=Parvularcula marina TaxID=2292771 RepID=UPI0035192C60